MSTKRWEFLRRAAFAAPVVGDWAEFGVATGKSAYRLSNWIPGGCTLWLFDSYEGLPEDVAHLPEGAYKATPPQSLLDRPAVRDMRGLFEDTVPGWGAPPLAFVHVDCDLYSSALLVLTHVVPRLVPGAVVVFDEWDWGEDQAWDESVNGHEWREIDRMEYEAAIRVAVQMGGAA